jgi:uncharacterized iron-regulated membrane protein
MPLRSVFFWLHLAAGLLAGILVLTMSVTGVALTYERQLAKWSDSEFKSVRLGAAEALPVEQILEQFKRQRPEAEPTGVTLSSSPTDPVAIAAGQQRTVYVDAYTGQVLGDANQGVRRVLSELRAWHRWLAVEGEGRPTARALIGWANVLFLFMIASGIYIWFPRRWSWASVKAIALFKPGASGKARDFNWHNVIGIWSAIPLFIVVASAVPISFPWGTALVYRAVGEEPPAARGGGRGGGEGEGPAQRRAGGRGARGGQRGEAGERAERQPVSYEGLSALMAQAQRQEDGWRTVNLRLPSSAEAPLVFAIDRGDGGQPHLRSTLTLSRAGDVVTYEAFSSQSTGRQLRSIMRFAHTGEVLGLPGQTVAGLVSAGGVVLVWTGIALAWRRFRAWIKRRGATPAEEPAIRSSAA